MIGMMVTTLMRFATANLCVYRVSTPRPRGWTIIAAYPSFLTRLTSFRRILLTSFSKKSSQPKNLMSRMPWRTSVTVRTRLSVNTTPLLRCRNMMTAHTTCTGKPRMKTPRPTSAE